MIASARARGAGGLVRDHRDGGVEDALHAGFEEQRDLHDGHLILGNRSSPGGNTLADQRPQEPLQPLAVPFIAENPLRDLRAIGGDLRAKALREGGADRLRLEQLVYDRVRRQRGRPELLEQPQRLGLPGAEPAS
jgi:hypothetical protein